jgi:hypothetical protein
MNGVGTTTAMKRGPKYAERAPQLPSIAGFVTKRRLVRALAFRLATHRRTSSSFRGLTRAARTWLLLVLPLLVFPAVASASPFGVPAHATTRELSPAPVPGLPGALPVNAYAQPGLIPQPAKPEPRQPQPNVVADEPAQPSKLLKKRNVPPFWLNREFDTHTTKAIPFPPLFVHRKPKAGHPEKLLHLDLALTFGWYDKRRQKRRWLNPAGLFIGSFSDHKTVWGAVPLLMGYKRVGEQFNFGQFPLVWWWGNRHVKNFLVLPVHYQQKAPDGFKGITGLIVWYGSKNLDDHDPNNDRKHRIVFPAFLRYRKGLKQVDVSPLYVGGRNELKGTKWRSVIPFFLWESLESGNRKELWTALFIHRRDQARRKRAWAIPPLLTFSSRSSRRGLMAITPLVWRGKDALKGSTTWIAGPVGTYRDDQQRNNWVAPLWFRFKDTRHQTSTSMFLPLVHVRKSPEETRVDTPLASGLRGKDGTRALGVYPLLSHVRWGGTGRKHQFLAGGLFWHVKNPRTFEGKGHDKWGVGPIVYRSRRGERYDFGIPPLLLFADREGTKSKQVFTPFLWRMRDKDPAVNRHAYVVAPFYVDKRKDDFQIGLPPVFMARTGKKHRWAILPPLLFGHYQDVKAKESLTIHPLFAHYKKPGHRTIGAGALFWDVKRPDERHSVFAPLYYRRQKGDKTLTFTWLGGAKRDGRKLTWVAANLYGERSEEKRGFGIVPLFFHQKRLKGPAKGATQVLFPLFLRDRRPDRDLGIYTPLVWRRVTRGEGARKGLAIVPLYFRQRQPSGVDVDAGIPFFYSRDKHRHTHTLIAGPFYHRLSRKTLHTGLAPVTWWTDSAEKRRLISLPLIFHQEDKKTKQRTTIAIPLWFDRRLANGRRTWMAFPFVLGRKGQHNFTRLSIVPVGYFDIFRMRKNFRFTGYVPFLFRYKKCGYRSDDVDGCEYTVWGSFPLFLAGKGRNRTTHGALGLYYFDKGPGGKRFYTLIGGGNYRPKERLMWYALTAFRDVSNTHKKTGFLPFVYHSKHRDKSKNLSTTVIAPPLYIGQRKGDRSWFQTALLVWNVRRPHKVTTVVLPPLFGHQHAYAERRLTWFAPLFLRDNHSGKDKSTTILPPFLFVQHRKGDKQTAIQFPLVWHFERKGNLTTLGVPMWWDFRRGSNRTQVVPVLYAGRKTATRNLHVIGPGLAWWTKGKGPKQGDRSWRALLGLFGGGIENGQRYAAIFGAKVKIKGGKAKGTIQQTASQKKKREARRFRSEHTDRNERIEARVGAL